MNMDAMFSSKTDLWETPQGLSRRVRAPGKREMQAVLHAGAGRAFPAVGRDVLVQSALWPGDWGLGPQGAECVRRRTHSCDAPSGEN